MILLRSVFGFHTKGHADAKRQINSPLSGFPFPTIVKKEFLWEYLQYSPSHLSPAHLVLSLFPRTSFLEGVLRFFLCVIQNHSCMYGIATYSMYSSMRFSHPRSAQLQKDVREHLYPRAAPFNLIGISCL